MPTQAPFRRVATTVIPPCVVIPGALLLGVTVLYRFHHFWRWLRLGALWMNPDNFVQLSLGAGANFLFGNSTPLRVAALMVAIPSRLVECMDEYNDLAEAYRKWVQACRGDFPRSSSVRWIKSSKRRWLSPSQELMGKESLLNVGRRIERVVLTTADVARRVFILSMVCVDAVEALALKKSACDRAVNELFLDGVNGVHRIAEQKERIQQKLEENRPLADKILRKLGSKSSAGRLIDTMSRAMDGIQMVDNGIQGVTKFGNGMVGDLGRHVLFGVCSVLAISDKIPAKWLPGKWEEKHFERGPTAQYAPAEWLRQCRGGRNQESPIRTISITMKRPPLKPIRNLPEGYELVVLALQG